MKKCLVARCRAAQCTIINIFWAISVLLYCFEPSCATPFRSPGSLNIKECFIATIYRSSPPRPYTSMPRYWKEISDSHESGFPCSYSLTIHFSSKSLCFFFFQMGKGATSQHPPSYPRRPTARLRRRPFVRL